MPEERYDVASHGASAAANRITKNTHDLPRSSRARADRHDVRFTAFIMTLAGEQIVIHCAARRPGGANRNRLAESTMYWLIVGIAFIPRLDR